MFLYSMFSNEVPLILVGFAHFQIHLKFIGPEPILTSITMIRSFCLSLAASRTCIHSSSLGVEENTEHCSLVKQSSEVSCHCEVRINM